LALALLAFNLASVFAAPTLIATIPLGVTPFAEALNPVTNRYYVTSAVTNQVLVIDGNTNTLLTTIPMGAFGNRPQGIGVNTATNRIYVCNFNSGTVVVIDGATNTILTSIPGFNGPSGLSVNSLTNRVYISEYFANRVSVLDGATNGVVTTVGVGGLPQGSTVNTANNRIYVGNSGTGNISIIDGATNTVIGTLGGYSFSADSTNNLLYLTAGTTLYVADGNTNAILRSANLGGGAFWGPVPAPSVNRVYITDYANNQVVVVDTNTLTTVATVPVGQFPTGANFNPNTNHLFVLNQNSNSVSVIADVNPPKISKKFGASAINLNGTTSLSFTITNPNTLNQLTGVSFTDNMPAGLVVANPPNVSNSCGGTLNAPANATTISLTAGTVATNTTCSITLNVTGTTPGVKNNITQPISATESGPGLPSNTATLTVNAPSADIALQKSVDNPKPNVNSNVTFTLKATNNGPSDATNLVVTDNLPAGLLQYVSYNPPSLGTVTVSGNSLSWNIGTLTNGSSATLQIVAQVCASGPIINTITKSQSEPDPLSINDSASIGLNAPTADLQIQKSVDKPSPLISDTVSFTVSATNLGPDNASGVVVKDLLPAGLELVSATAPSGTSYQASSGLWTIGALNNGQSLSLLIQAKVTQEGTIVNTASKNGEDQYDFNPLNDSASVVLKVGTKAPGGKGQPHPADFVAQLRVTPDRLVSSEASNLISYTFTLKNIGEGRAGQVGLRFPLDSNLELGYTQFIDPRIWVSAIVTSSTQPYIQINLPAMEAKQTITGTIVFRPAASASPTATLFTRYAISWDDEERGGKQTASNAVRFALDGEGINRDESGGAVQWFEADTTTVSNGTSLKVRGDFYAPNEYVTLWYTDKQGVSVPLGTKQADDKGQLELEFVAKDLVVGDSYVIAGIGSRSEVTGSLAFTVSS
jgi:uncharacterized repeat protein (TIGR01451 family)